MVACRLGAEPPGARRKRCKRHTVLRAPDAAERAGRVDHFICTEIVLLVE